jgi:hypothetical protein
MDRLLAAVTADLSTDLLLLILTSIVVLFIYAQFKTDRFDIRDVLIDPQTQKLSLHNLGQFIALIISSWGFIYQTLHNQLSEFLCGAYMCAWVGAVAANKFLAKPDDKTD